jgi:hypothetical protein
MDKLYVLILASLTPAQKAVQAGHAVAEYMLRHPGRWNNQTLVYLTATNLDLCLWMARGVPHAVFREPDLGGVITAFAAEEVPYWKKMGLEGFD